ncbi:TMAO reductase system periplasmic protein TorT [Nitrospirillum sp. BR 11828]|uniref:TMAO reductase system periplasmic protein TorT n=1 Tax=Nitrospirillum sp. BR 11828 TaxID=3104325 RepID=UPI002ACAADD9|nr:TMAO reductase system periplasmic protein TorT [Nitrospirillum sp. BR 11828]MDZ5648363.1 TMAO reductase system periplasmic protein TorT [Nitrospirillum sp. BR 11828]
MALGKGRRWAWGLGGFLAVTGVMAYPEMARPDTWVSVASDGRTAPYVPLVHASRPWRICALLPGAQDKFWWGVSWGLVREAERQGVLIGVYQAGGYDRLEVQRAQVDACRELKPDAYIVAAISSDGLDAQAAAIADSGRPLIDLINGMASPYVSAHIVSNFREDARVGADYILAHRAEWERAAGRPLKVGWLPGPKGAEWSDAMEAAALAILGRAGVEVIHGGYGATALPTQMDLVRDLFDRVSDIDVVFGNAVAIQAAASYLRSRHDASTHLVATYATDAVADLIKSGIVDQASADSPIIQARIAVDLAVRALERKPHGVWNVMTVDRLDRTALAGYDLSRIAVPQGERFQLRPLSPASPPTAPMPGGFLPGEPLPEAPNAASPHLPPHLGS